MKQTHVVVTELVLGQVNGAVGTPPDLLHDSVLVHAVAGPPVAVLV